MENKENKKTYYLLIAAAIIIPVLLTMSYAFFQPDILGEDKGVSGASTDVFDVELITEDNVHINASDVLLITALEIEEKSQKSNFKVVSGDNKHYITYKLSLSNLTISSNLQVSDFKWQLLKNGSIVNSGTFSGVMENHMILASNMQIGANVTEEFEIRIWIEESGENQLDLLNGSFSGKISLTADMVHNPITIP